MADEEIPAHVPASNSVGLLGLLYFIVAANFVDILFSCDLRRALDSSLLAKHAVLLLGCVFWVAESYATGSFLALLGKAFGVYILFVMSTKSSTWALAPVIVLIITDQLVRLYIKTDGGSNPKTLNKLESVRTGLQVVCVGIIIVGFLAYLAKQRVDHGADFKLSNFMLGTLECTARSRR